MSDSLVTRSNTQTVAETSGPSARVENAQGRFLAALTRLEGGVADAVHKVADLARRTGWEDGHTEGRKEGWAEGHAAGLAEARQAAPVPSRQDGEAFRLEALALREELAASKDRERALAEALTEAQNAIDQAIEDIRAFSGER